MARVFISHSSADREVAGKVCELLEQRGVTCWIAPRDITAGSEWAAAISEAIAQASIFLLIYSGNSAKSTQVPKEMNLAEKRGAVIVPYKIDNTELVGAFDYFLTGSHWINASPLEGDYRIDELYNVIVCPADPVSEQEKPHSDNVLSQHKEHYTLTAMYEQIADILRESDDKEDLERFRNALHDMASPTSYIVLGESGTGKTSLIRAVFSGVLDMTEDMICYICEYRWGEQEFATPVNAGVQRKFVTSDEMMGLSVIDTKGLDIMSNEALEKTRKLTESCAAIFVVFEPKNVTSPRLWDILESFPKKNMVFFLTKSDTADAETIERCIEKLKTYMSDSGISAPVFPVSTVNESANTAIVPMSGAREYIRNNIIGVNPKLSKQLENVNICRRTLNEIVVSIEKRKQQYVSDSEILRCINREMDRYMLSQRSRVNQLINMLAEEINKDIDNYQAEIISKLDPHKIKERFKDSGDFEFYLNSVNDNYKKMMTDSVNTKVVEAIKGGLNELEKVFREAVGFFNSRESIIDLNDKFYSSLSTGRRTMVAETKNSIVATGDFYRTLSDASYEAFMKIWAEREKYDERLRNVKNVSAVGGAVAAGATTAAVLSGASVSVNLGILAMTGVVGTAFLVAVSAVVGAIVIKAIAKAMFEPKLESQMMQATQKCIDDFKNEVNKTRTGMIKSVTQQVSSIFEKELASADGCFTEFRISVNSDERKIPELERKLELTRKLLNEVDMLTVGDMR